MTGVMESRDQLAQLLTVSDAPAGSYSFEAPAIEPQPAVEPATAGVAYLTTIGPQLYLLLTDADSAGELHDAAAAALAPGDQVHVIGPAGSLSYTLDGAPGHQPGLGIPYTAIPIDPTPIVHGAGDQLAGELRVQLGDRLPVPAPVFSYVPETPAPPCVIIEPGDDFLQEDDQATYGDPQLLATYDVFVLVQLDEEHDNETADRQLIELLPYVLDAVRDDERWWLLGMSKPQAFLTTEWVHHGVRLSVQTRVTL